MYQSRPIFILRTGLHKGVHFRVWRLCIPGAFSSGGGNGISEPEEEMESPMHGVGSGRIHRIQYWYSDEWMNREMDVDYLWMRWVISQEQRWIYHNFERKFNWSNLIKVHLSQYTLLYFYLFLSLCVSFLLTVHEAFISIYLFYASPLSIYSSIYLSTLFA